MGLLRRDRREGRHRLRSSRRWRHAGVPVVPRGRLNFAENLLRGADADPAVIESDEDGISRRMSRGELRAEVARVVGWAAVGRRGRRRSRRRHPAQPHRGAGGTAGHRRRSARHGRRARRISGRSPFSTGSARSRPRCCSPPPRYRYGGKEHDISDRIAELAAQMPSLTDVVLVGGDAAVGAARAHRWADFGDVRRAAGLYPRAVLAAALRALHLRHHRQAQGDCPFDRRRAAAAPEGAPATRRPEARRHRSPGTPTPPG